jgi:hypothetical protein
MYLRFLVPSLESVCTSITLIVMLNIESSQFVRSFTCGTWELTRVQLASAMTAVVVNALDVLSTPRTRSEGRCTEGRVATRISEPVPIHVPNRVIVWVIRIVAAGLILSHAFGTVIVIVSLFFAEVAD